MNLIQLPWSRVFLKVQYLDWFCSAYTPIPLVKCAENPMWITMGTLMIPKTTSVSVLMYLAMRQHVSQPSKTAYKIYKSGWEPIFKVEWWQDRVHDHRDKTAAIQSGQTYDRDRTGCHCKHTICKKSRFSLWWRVQKHNSLNKLCCGLTVINKKITKVGNNINKETTKTMMQALVL